MYKMIFAGLARAEEHSDGDDPAHALPRPLGALHRDGQGRSGGCKEQEILSCAFHNSCTHNDIKGAPAVAPIPHGGLQKPHPLLL